MCAAVVLLGLPAAARAATPTHDSLTTETITAGGTPRTYLLFVPASYWSPHADHTMAVLFHGFGGRDSDLVRYVRPAATLAGMVVAFPQGTGPSETEPSGASWNAGQCCGPAMRADVDDVGFAVTLIHALQARFHPARVVAGGYSNGGMLSWLLACSAPGLLHAIVDTSGTDTAATCQPSQPITVIGIHGTADPTIPYDGGYNDESVVLTDTNPWRGAVDVNDVWGRRDDCNVHTVARRPGYLLSTWSACANGVTARLYTVYGMHHDIASFPGPVDFGSLVVQAARS